MFRICVTIILSVFVCVFAQAQVEYGRNGKKIGIEDYLKLAQEQEEQGNNKEASRYVNKVATIYWEQKDYNQALSYFDRSVKLNEAINNIHGVMGIYGNMAMIYADKAEYDKSLEYFTKTIAHKRKGTDKYNLSSALINTSVVLNNLKRYDESVTMLDEALRLSQELSDIEQMRSCYGMLAETYEKKGDAEQTLHYFELYRTFHEKSLRDKEGNYIEEATKAKLKAQLLALEQQRTTLELEMQRLENQKKDQTITVYDSTQKVLRKDATAKGEKIEELTEIARLKALEEEARQKEAEAKRREEAAIRNGLLAGMFFLLILAGLIYKNSQARKKANRLLAEQNKKISEQKQKIEHHKQALEVSLMKEQEDATKLEEAYEQLNATYESLRDTQMQLVQSEKMASLGVMTAGIAHEINNPLNFIYVGVDNLKQAIEDTQHVIALYNKLAVEGSPEDNRLLLKQIEEAKEDMFWSEIQGDMNTTLNDIKLGSERLRNIVSGLRMFARKDEEVQGDIDIAELLDSTLILLNNVLKDRVNIHKKYTPDLHMPCFPGQLSQVFMNLIANASQAIDDGGGDIWIETKSLDENYITITIKDNGNGIPEHIKDRIFEPFFTTKEVGKGTGLGLSISYGIIQKHNGEISVESEIGKGTSFAIKLPRFVVDGERNEQNSSFDHHILTS